MRKPLNTFEIQFITSMRIHLSLSKSKELIPFNYQPKLVGCLHRWLGKDNETHGEVALYSYSWLRNAVANKNGLNVFSEGSWFISAHSEEMIKALISGIQKDPYVFAGMEVTGITIQQTPEYGTLQKFSVANPVFVKRKVGEKVKFFYAGDEHVNDYLTQTLQTKLAAAGIASDGVNVTFDPEYNNPKQKGFEHNGIFNKGTVCPVIVSGTAEQIAFAWNVGVGNSTGIGFGALI